MVYILFQTVGKAGWAAMMMVKGGGVRVCIYGRSNN